MSHFKLPRCAAMLTAFVVTACGGGSGGGTASTPAGNTDGVAYVGNRLPATITTANASVLTALALDISGQATQANNAAALVKSVDGGSVPAFTETLAGRLRAIAGEARVPYTQQPRVKDVSDGALACAGGGTLSVTGALDGRGIGTLTAEYRACRSGLEEATGTITIRIDEFDAVLGPLATTLVIPSLQIKSPGEQIRISGTLRESIVLSNRTDTTQEELVIVDEVAGGSQWRHQVETVVRFRTIPYWTGSTQSVTGRVYDSVHGYVDVSTLEPGNFSASDGATEQRFPDAGQWRLSGATGQAIHAVAASSHHLRLAIDASADGRPAVDATLRWDELLAPAGAELADSDADGMHDGWERAHGLRLDDPRDASADSDSDGISNLEEYRRGTDPQDAASTPPMADLRLYLIGPSLVTPGVEFSVPVTLYSLGPAQARHVRIDLDLPTGVTLLGGTDAAVDATPGSVVCVTAPSPGCVLSDLPDRGSVKTVTLRLVATQSGFARILLRGTSDALDPTPVDATVPMTVFVGAPVAGLQALVDAAPPGSTVLVPEGVWAGPVDLGRKALTIRSAAGPERTIVVSVLPSDMFASSIPPAGFVVRGTATIQGFTFVLQHTSAIVMPDATARVRVLGNVFEGGTFVYGEGADSVIGGNGFATSIDGNVFRGNRCIIGGDLPLGLIALQSEPADGGTEQMVVSNNVFVDNACAGVAGRAGAIRTVVNNTFVGNRAGVVVQSGGAPAQGFARNNLVSGNDVGIWVDSFVDLRSGLPWRSNLVHGNSADYRGIPVQTGVLGNLLADPLFVDRSARDLRLRVGSPAIDAGLETDTPATDIVGVVRPVDGDGDGEARKDIGAFERVP